MCIQYHSLVARRVTLVVALAFCPKILGRWQRHTNDNLSVFCYNQICLNFLYSEEVGMVKRCSSARAI